MEWDRELTEWERKWDGVEEGVGWSGRGSWIEIGMEWEWDGVERERYGVGEGVGRSGGKSGRGNGRGKEMKMK